MTNADEICITLLMGVILYITLCAITLVVLGFCVYVVTPLQVYNLPWATLGWCVALPLIPFYMMHK